MEANVEELTLSVIQKFKEVSENLKSIREINKFIKLINRSICTTRKLIKEKSDLIGNFHKIESCMTQLKYYRLKMKIMKQELTSENASTENKNVLRWENLESCFNSRISSGIIVNNKYIDPKIFLKKAFRSFSIQIKKALATSLLKVNTVFYANFIKPGQIEAEIKHLATRNEIIDRSTNLREFYEENVINKILAKLESFQERDSSWALSKILLLKVNINSYNPVRYGMNNYIELPKFIKRKRSVLNIKSSDEYCFLHCIMASKFPRSRAEKPDRVSSYPKFSDHLRYENINFPIQLKDISEFEFMNSISINVFAIIENEMISPIYLSKYNFEEKVNLLALENKQSESSDSETDDEDLSNIHHFALITNLSGLVNSQMARIRNKTYICNSCLNHFITKEALDRHTQNCTKMNLTQLKMPSENDKILKFSNFKNEIDANYVIYFDLECLLLDNKDQNATKSMNRFQTHEVFSISYYLKCNFNEEFSKFKIYTGKDCDTWFCNELYQIALEVNERLADIAPMELTPEEEEEHQNATMCHICKKPILAGSENCKVRNHSHTTSAFYGTAHRNCNLNYKETHDITVVSHNLSGYDSHFIIRALSKKNIPGSIKLLPLNKDKYLSFRKYIEKTSICFKFIDSFRFMSESLDNLNSYLDENQRSHIKSFAKTEEEFRFLQRKGVFPYEYMNSWEKLEETKLPPIEKFYSHLRQQNISLLEYEHAQNVWKVFKIQNLKQYAELYLKTDVLILADVFESFRKVCKQHYSLDPAHYTTAPGLSYDAMLKMTGVELELITDIDQLTFIEKGIRGGVTQVSNRYAKANNEFMHNYDSSLPSSYLIYLDINSMYCLGMSKPLPKSDFEFIKNEEINSLPNILDLDENSEVGYIYEVDLVYPKTLFETHKDLPLLPEHLVPPASKSKVSKLVTTFYEKKNYVIHYLALKQAVQLGIKVEKIHRVLTFKQSCWMKEYIDLNIELRKQSKNAFETSFFKGLCNQLFGKTMENVRKYRDVKLVSRWEGRYGANYYISHPNFHSCSIIDADMVIIEMKRQEILFNKPIYAGMSILDISKTFMYDFHYNHILSNFGNNAKLLYTDTDSLIYQFENTNFYEHMKKNLKFFDTSNYSPDNIFNMPLVNKKVLGCFKDENGGRIMTEFIGLKAKLYATRVQYFDHEISEIKKKLEAQGESNEVIQLTLDNWGVLRKAKGCQKSVVRSITFDDFYQCLFNKKDKFMNQYLIRSEKHKVHTVKQNKLVLNCEDDKRIIDHDSTDTKPWGYY